MAIRLRLISGHMVALNAAVTDAKEGDVYLNDSMHHALSTKFGVDFKKMGFIQEDLADPIVKELMINEEIKRLLHP